MGIKVVLFGADGDSREMRLGMFIKISNNLLKIDSSKFHTRDPVQLVIMLHSQLSMLKFYCGVWAVKPGITHRNDMVSHSASYNLCVVVLIRTSPRGCGSI